MPHGSGIHQPLTLPRHWRRNVGRLVKVKLTDGSSLTGRVTAHDEDPDGGTTLEVSGRERTLPYAQVDRALVQIEFNRRAADEAATEDEVVDEPVDGEEDDD